MRAINILKSSAILLSLTWLHSHNSAWAESPGGPAETFPTNRPQLQDGHGVGNAHGCGRGRGGPQQPSGMATIVVPPSAAPPSSPSRPSPARPTSAIKVPASHPELRHARSPEDQDKLPRQAPAAPPVGSNPPPAPAPAAAPPASPPLITPAPSLPKGPEYITNPEDMKAGVGTYNGIDANGKAFRFVQTTYYSCVTRGTSAYCGWHRPIVDVVYGSGADARMGPGRAAVGVACLLVAVLFAMLV